jgi:hypothetical protein
MTEYKRIAIDTSKAVFTIHCIDLQETVSNLGGGMGSAEMAGSGKWDEVARYGRVDRGQRHRLHL